MAYDVEVAGVYDDFASASADQDRLNRAWWEAEGRAEYEDEETQAFEAAANPIDYEPETVRADLAARVHFTDPRVRLLAQARYQLKTGRSRADWLVLGKDHPDALIYEAREWIRAAVAAGLLPPPEDG